MSRKTREWTCAVLDAMDQGLLDPKAVAEMCMSYMSESQVADMCRVNDLQDLIPEEQEEEQE
jgi:hypothetical protein|nr:hypothetical protein [Oxalobacteraceae bacterium]